MIDRPANAFLRLISDDDFTQLTKNLTFVDLANRLQLQRNEDETGSVFFPLTCLISMVATDLSALTCEASMVGNEGAAGLIEASSTSFSTVDAGVQLAGRAWRASAGACRQLVHTSPAFSAAAWRIAELQLIESRQTALCQARHPVEGRFAKWILESYDRSGRPNPLLLTQDVMANILAVQRTTISGFAARLQDAQLIRYRRGLMEIVDVGGLEAVACDCRALCKEQRQRLELRAIFDS